VKEQATKLEIFRSYLLDRIKESRVGVIDLNLDGDPTFEVMPEIQNYTWVIDLSKREGVVAIPTSGSAGARLTITEEKTNE
tara:strand:+ start:275 stop:517 length:243 start_codon:yes stop_codon:yes gene_type:complete